MTKLGGSGSEESILSDDNWPRRTETATFFKSESENKKLQKYMKMKSVSFSFLFPKRKQCEVTSICQGSLGLLEGGFFF